MMNNAALIPGILVLIVLIITLSFLLSKNRYEDFKKRLMLKSLCSLMFWLFGWIALWYTNTDLVLFALLMIVGFTLSFLGDVFLVFSKDHTFILGLFSFLLAHVAYSISIMLRYGFGIGSLIAFGIISLIGFGIINFSGVFELKKMLIPANLYLFVITFMLANAISTMFSLEKGLFPAILTALGALAFCVSDSILAYGIFSPKSHKALEKPVLITYYSAQILLAMGMMTFLI